MGWTGQRWPRHIGDPGTRGIQLPNSSCRPGRDIGACGKLRMERWKTWIVAGSSRCESVIRKGVKNVYSVMGRTFLWSEDRQSQLTGSAALTEQGHRASVVRPRKRPTTLGRQQPGSNDQSATVDEYTGRVGSERRGSKLVEEKKGAVSLPQNFGEGEGPWWDQGPRLQKSSHRGGEKRGIHIREG